MTAILARARNQGCLSDYHLDGLVVGAHEADGETNGHLAECARCADRLKILKALSVDFDGALPMNRDAERVTLRGAAPRPRHFWAGGVAGALALAAGALLWVQSVALTPAGDETRLKGGASVGFYVEHAGQLRRGHPGEVVQAGDKLQFVYATPRPAQIIVLSIDGANKASVYFDSASLLAPTRGQLEEPLPSSILLDDVLGDETLWGIACPRPEDARDLRTRLEADQGGFTAPAACSATQWSITKRR